VDGGGGGECPNGKGKKRKGSAPFCVSLVPVGGMYVELLSKGIPFLYQNRSADLIRGKRES